MVNWFASEKPNQRQRLTYRGYMLELSDQPSGWRLGIHPMRPDLPILAHRQLAVPSCSRDEVLSVGYHHIDVLLAS